MGAGKTVSLFDYRENQAMPPLDPKLSTCATSLEWINPSESALLVEGTRKGAIFIWDIRQPRVVSSFVAFPVFSKDQPKGSEVTPAMLCRWSQSAGLLATAGTTQLVKVWNLETEQLACCRATGEESPVVSLLSEERSGFTCALRNGRVLQIDARTHDVLRLFQSPQNDAKLVGLVSVSEFLFATAEFDGWLRFFDRRNASTAVSERFLAPTLTALEAQPAMEMMVTTSLRSELRILDREGETKQVVRATKGFRTKPLGNLMGAAIHPLSGAVACYNARGVVCVYE